MIVITGGAGMIGSMIAWQLNQEGRDDLLIVDRQKHSDQWQNLCHRRYEEYLDKEELLPWLEAGAELDAVIHMGAISATTERDWNRLPPAGGGAATGKGPIPDLLPVALRTRRMVETLLRTDAGDTGQGTRQTRGRPLPRIRRRLPGNAGRNRDGRQSHIPGGRR